MFGGGQFNGGGRSNNFTGGQPSNNYRGGGGGRQSGRGGRGRGGRNSGGYNPSQGGLPSNQEEPPTYGICNFDVRGGNCKNGPNCRFVHNLAAVAFTIPMQQQGQEPLPVKTLALLNMPDGPKVLSGSTDGNVKVWNLASEKPEQDVQSLPTTGVVEHIEVSGSSILWSVDEPISPELPDNTVGMVYLLNTTDMSSIAIKRSEEFPYTHPFGEIRSFTIAVLDGVTFVITAGGEGLIRTWRFDAAQGAFEQIMVLEGHIRAVTCVLLNGGILWSGSVDSTIRVWDLASGKCAATLSAIGGAGGHTDAVSCLEFIPNAGAEAFIASGSADKTVKLWKASGGELMHTCTHSSMVTALKAFRDTMGGIQVLVVGLLEGTIVIRSCVSMKVLFYLDQSISRTKAIWSIVDLGQSCFGTGSDDGNIVVWKINSALADK